MLQPGTRLKDTYLIIGQLGSGGGGIVYKAYHERLDIYVVVKQIKDRIKGVLDTKAEANILKSLKHPNLPRVYDFIETDGEIYTVMDYIPGDSMDKYLAGGAGYDAKQVYQWALQLSYALEYLHGQKPPIIHSDIKPGNIMLMPDGKVCLIDFNISLAFDKEQSTSIGISRGYSPPEQYHSQYFYLSQISPSVSSTVPESRPRPVPPANVNAAGSDRPQLPDTVLERVDPAIPEAALPGKLSDFIGLGVDARSDIYSLGATLYHLLTGVKPSENYAAIVPLHEYEITIGQGFRTIIEKMMELDPQKRYRDGAELRYALEHVYELDAEYIRFRKKNRRRKLMTAALFAAGVGLTAAGVLTVHKERIAAYNQYIQEAEILTEQGDYEQAESEIAKSLKIDSRSVDAYEKKVYLLYMRGDYDECTRYGREVLNDPLIRSDSEGAAQPTADIYYLMGNAYLEQQDYSNAIPCFETAIGKNQKNSLYFRDYAIALATVGYLDDAEQALDTAIELGLGEDSIYMVQGEIAVARGNSEQALEYLNRSIQTASTDNLWKKAVILCAQTYSKLGNQYLDDEIALLEQAESALPSDVSVLVSEQLADAYARKAASAEEFAASYYPKALQKFENLYEKGYETRQIMENIAVIYQQIGDLDETERMLTVMEERYPDDYRTYKRWAFLEADRQQQKPSDDRDYSAVKDYYQKAVERYDKTGTADGEMMLLESMMRELEDGGWFREGE